MNKTRRSFLQKLGFAASIAGIESLPVKAFANENFVPALDNTVTTNAIAETAYGKVRGYVRNGINTFKGIPYGGTTEGAARFMPPIKPKPWTGVRNTLSYGPISPQKMNTGWLNQEYPFIYQWVDGFQNEDCLRLNVWSPGLKDGKKRPVLFWIHGGGFVTGSSQEHPSYDGENLSRLGDVVVVSINHRLNVFGYLDLSAYGSKYESSANVGMLDIVSSLEWVRDNIDQFGGDKNNVTIYGQSGGATKVITLMAMPSAKGLFHKAISQSNSIVQVSTKAYATKLASYVLEDLNISPAQIEEIHNVPVARLLEATAAAEKKMGSSVPSDVGRAGLQPVVDGKILPFHPFDPAAPAISADIPFMVGTTRNEGSGSIDNEALEALDEAGLKKRILDKYPNKGDQIYAVMRKVHPDKKPIEVLSFLSAQNPMAFLQAQRKAEQKKAPVYLYMFSWHTPLLDGRPRSFHCSELPFVFANTDKCDTYTGGSEEARTLSNKMALSWINFARNGNPNHSGLPNWPSFNNAPGSMMVFNKKCEVKTDPDGEARQILERAYYNKEV